MWSQKVGAQHQAVRPSQAGLEYVFSRKLHLSWLDQKCVGASGVDSEVFTGAIRLQRALSDTALRGVERVEAVCVEHIEHFYGEAKLLVAEGMERLGKSIIHGEVAVCTEVVPLPAISYISETKICVGLSGGNSFERGFHLVDGIVMVATGWNGANLDHVAVEREVRSPVTRSLCAVGETGAVVDEAIELEAADDAIQQAALI